MWRHLDGQELPSQKVTPEPRLYGQLAQCCLRDRQGRRATEATVWVWVIGTGGTWLQLSQKWKQGKQGHGQGFPKCIPSCKWCTSCQSCQLRLWSSWSSWSSLPSKWSSTIRVMNGTDLRGLQIAHRDVYTYSCNEQYPTRNVCQAQHAGHRCAGCGLDMAWHVAFPDGFKNSWNFGILLILLIWSSDLGIKFARRRHHAFGGWSQFPSRSPWCCHDAGGGSAGQQVVGRPNRLMADWLRLLCERRSHRSWVSSRQRCVSCFLKRKLYSFCVMSSLGIMPFTANLNWSFLAYVTISGPSIGCTLLQVYLLYCGIGQEAMVKLNLPVHA